MADHQAAARGSWLSVAVPLGGFLLVIGAGLALWAIQQGNVRQQRQIEVNYNEAHGLPADFPSAIVPLIEGAEVTSQETGEARSAEGEPMAMWNVVAQVDSDDRKAIFDYYNELLLDRGFRQTQFFSIPSHDASGPNYGVDFGNEEMSISFVIEKKSADEMTQVQITVYRVK